MIKFGDKSNDFLNYDEIVNEYLLPIYKSDLSEDENYCLSEFLGGTIEGYNLIESACKGLKIEHVYDIGSCYGHQSILFLKNGIKYTGIEQCSYMNPRFTEEGAKYIMKRFPCYIPQEDDRTTWNHSAVISSLCITFLQKDEDELKWQIRQMCLNSKYFIVIVSKKYIDLLKEHYYVIAYMNDVFVGKVGERSNNHG